MRRAAAFLLVLTVVAVALVATGVVSVRIDVRPPGGVGAAPFWQEKVSDGAALPPALGIWIELARAVRPGVVNVSTTQRGQVRGPLSDDFFRRFFEREPGARPRRSLGSGVIASRDGYIVTNVHVVRDADEIVVRLADHSEHRARLIGGDPKTDIALLKIDADNLATIAFGDSDRLEVGAPVMAIGNPFGLEQTVTTGIVSAKERFIGSGPYDDFIQTDASINPGNSGGPLIDVTGALIGINTAIFSQSGGSVGIGFAIPINLAKEVLLQLRQTGKVTRGYLGVSVAPVTPEARRRLGLPAQRGALVAEVAAGSPAAEAGIKPGDVIVQFQDAQIQEPHELTRRVGGTPPGTRVTVQVARGEGRQTLKATLAQLREAPAPDER
jgi:serine protease Do